VAVTDSGDLPNVVRLPGEGPTPEPTPPPSPPGRLHGIAIMIMGISAIVGVAGFMAFITITWPQDMSRYVIGVSLVAGIVFLASASIAVFSAARDTYRNGSVHVGDE
jgi:hypothetical protein